MVFSSTVFLFVFLPAVLIVYFNPFIKNRKFRNIFLFLASVAFYAYGEPVFVFLMLASILITWLIGLAFEKYQHRKKLLLVLGISFHIALLFVFKYASFLTEQIGLLLNIELTVNIDMPIGISFFTFQLMSYLFDVYREKAEPQRNLLYLGLYISMFPQLIAGPIVRYTDVAYEIEHRTENLENVTEGMARFIYGLAKKLLLANYLAVIADNIYLLSEYSNIALLTAWLGALAYTLQIYFDFSGYSDMAIGLGRIFGFHFSENFNYPYIADSVTEYWHRWHISLSQWFRDYVYFPLGGNRVKKPLWIRNMFVVWLLTGIWHGANWTFLVWGLLYFLVLLFEKETGFASKLGWLSHIYVILTVVIAFVFFRSTSLSNALSYLRAMFRFNNNDFSDAIFRSYISGGWTVLAAGVLLSMPVFPWLKNKIYAHSEIIGTITESVLLIVLFGLSILTAVSSTYNPFIYFNF